MIDIRVYIENQNIYMEDNVFVDIKLPCVPRVGDQLILGRNFLDELECSAKYSLQVLSNYAPDWFYGKSYQDLENNEWEVKDKHVNDFSFGDAIRVTHVEFRANHNTVYIELGKP